MPPHRPTRQGKTGLSLSAAWMRRRRGETFGSVWHPHLSRERLCPAPRGRGRSSRRLEGNTTRVSTREAAAVWAYPTEDELRGGNSRAVGGCQ